MKHTLLICMLISGTLHAQYTHFVAAGSGVFHPEFLVVEAGDTVQLQLADDHTFTEVSASTFRAGGVEPNGGIRIGDGFGQGYRTIGHTYTAIDADQARIVFADPGDFYFVSEGHNRAVAKMHIVVIPAAHTGLSGTVDQIRPHVFPNPANDQVRFGAHMHIDMMSVEVFDESGRHVLQAVVRGGEPMSVVELPAGLYVLRLTDGLSKVYGVERLRIERN